MLQPAAGKALHNSKTPHAHAFRTGKPPTLPPPPHTQVYSAPDPSPSPPTLRRRAEQMEASGGDELAAVKKYFDTAGFERWNKIYGETDEVNKVNNRILMQGGA